MAKLPFTFKKDLRDNYPTKMFSAPLNQVVRYHVSSGTTGKPTVVGYTRGDIDCWTTSLARAFTSCGLGHGDVIRSATATACSPAAWALTTAPKKSVPASSPWAWATPSARSS